MNPIWKMSPKFQHNIYIVKEREALLCSTGTSSSPYWITVFLFSDCVAPQYESRLVDEACRSHGFFLVVNHKVDANLISNVHRYMDTLFCMPLFEKTKSNASSFTRRFSVKLPWKETLFMTLWERRLIEHSWRVFQRLLGECFNGLGYGKFSM